MRIALFGLSETFGGVERFILNAYKLLSDENIHFDFFVFSAVPDYLKLLSDQDSTVIITSRRENYFRFCADLKRAFSKKKYDVLWDNCCTLSCFEPVVYAKKAGISKIIVHSHNGENMGGKLTGLLHNLNKRRIARYATDYFSCSKIASQFMFPESVLDRVTIINNFIDAKKYEYNEDRSKEIRKKFNMSDRIVIGHVGRFHPQKNHVFIIDVFASFLKNNPSAMLVLCGDGQLRNDVESYAKSKKLEKNVLFLGNVHNIEEIYQLFDVFLFPSVYEGLPFALIEAQAAGIPCLVSSAVSSDVRITKNVFFENLSAPVQKWEDDLEKIASLHKEKTYADIRKSGFDMEGNKGKIIHCLKN